MPKCPKGKHKIRVSIARKGHPSPSKKPKTGHAWEGHGNERRCSICGGKPK